MSVELLALAVLFQYTRKKIKFVLIEKTAGANATIRERSLIKKENIKRKRK